MREERRETIIFIFFSFHNCSWWIQCCITTPMLSLSLNCELIGYFQEARGMRLVYRILQPCLECLLTHLWFADDWLIFTKWKLDSVTGVQNVLIVFYFIFFWSVAKLCKKWVGFFMHQQIISSWNTLGVKVEAWNFTCQISGIPSCYKSESSLINMNKSFL